MRKPDTHYTFLLPITQVMSLLPFYTGLNFKKKRPIGLKPVNLLMLKIPSI